MFDPQSSPELEWVELCNPNDVPVGLEGYTLWDDENAASVAPNFPVGSAVPATECVVLVSATRVFDFVSHWSLDTPVVLVSSFPALTNSGDRLQLWDTTVTPTPDDVESGAGAIICFDYPASLGDGVGSIQLVSMAADPAVVENWVLSTAENGASVSTVGDVGTPGVAP
jgi:hypothetical protein